MYVYRDYFILHPNQVICVVYGVFDSFTDYPYGLPICCMPKIVINKEAKLRGQLDRSCIFGGNFRVSR